MSNVRPIYKLPELQPHQCWACEEGCTFIRPNKHRHVYRQSWDARGNLTEELAEYYYTCGRDHLLMVWDNNTSDYAVLDPEYYQESEE